MRRDQEQIKSELIRRRDEFFQRRKLRRKRIRIAAVPSVCCLLLICALTIPQLQLKDTGGYEDNKTDVSIPIPEGDAAILSIDITGQPYGSKHYTDTQKIAQLMACLKAYPHRETNTIENESAPGSQEIYATVTCADGKQYIFLISESSDGNPANDTAQGLKKLLDSLPPDA
ncbi:MAG: hypothetical protein KH354_00620 [Clostridiales bacterium]|nr:hypothetical protein [Clostridiales bacterium]